MHKGKIACIIFTVIVLYMSLPQIYRSCVKINKLKAEKNQISEKIQLEKSKIEEYNNSIKALEEEFYREKISRDRLQMIKDGEEIYRLKNQK